MTVRDVYDIIDRFAPFATQEEYDHSGLQVGDGNAAVTGVLVAVDLSLAVIDEAVQKGCNLIVVHHPPVWEALPSLTEQNYTQRLLRRMVQNDLHCIAAHTNVDKCRDGNCEALARLLGGRVEGRLQSDECTVVFSFAPITKSALLDKVRTVLQDPYAYGVGEDAVVCRGAVCTGAGYNDRAMQECIDQGMVYITGEVKHNYLRSVQDRAGHLLVIGHFASEKVFEQIIETVLEKAGVSCVISKQDNPCGIRKGKE